MRDSSHPVGGEGVGSTLLDGGGLWSSDEARGKDTAGDLEDVDGWRPPARRALLDRGLLTPFGRHVRPASEAVPSPAEIRLGSNRGPPPGGRVDNGYAGQSVSSKR